MSIINEDGSLHQLLEIDQYKLSEIRLGTVYFLLGSMGNKLYGFDNTGTTVNMIQLEEPILNFSIENDKIFVLTASKIYVFNEDFSPIQNQSLSNYGTAKKLKVIDAELQIFTSQNNASTVVILDQMLNVNGIKTIVADIPNNAKIDFNNEHCAVANPHTLYYSAATRFRDFSLGHTANFQSNWTDIGISESEAVEVLVVPVQFSTPGVQKATISMHVKLTNYGNHVLNSCRINYHQGMHYICGQLGYSQEFFDLNLAPGGSTWLSLGIVHDETNYFQGIDGVISRNICVYTSFPNQQTDLEVANDAFCNQVILGYVGLEENSIHPREKTLVKIVDLVGREIPFQSNQVMIYLYNDGSSEKVFIMD